MKKLFFILAFAICYCLNISAQAKSLTVDCQTPGWLSSMINYGDQQTLENIKVTGYINGTDIQFIYDLNNRSLTGVIDLEDVSIVKGGTFYTNNYPKTIQNDNEMPASFFYDQKKPIQKFIYPKTLVKQPMLPFQNAGLVDSLIWTSTIVKSLNISNELGYSNYVYLPEGIETIKQIPTGCKITLPNSITKVDYINQNIIIYSFITNPESVNVLYESYNSIDGHQYWNAFANCTFYIPKGTMEKYLSSNIATKKTYKNNTAMPNGNTFIEYYDIERVELPSSVTMYKGDSQSLDISIYPDKTFVSKIDYVSSKPDVASINYDGIITAYDYGQAEISATPRVFIKGLETKTGTCIVKVLAHVNGVQMQEKMDLKIGEEKSLGALTTPLDVSDNLILYESNNLSIAEVTEEGIVKGKSKGKCTITATSVDGGYTATCEVTVTQPAETLTLEKHSLSLKVSETETLFAQITPTTADNKNINWYSRDEKVAKVDNNGKVNALASGDTWIVAISEDNTMAKDSCKLTVIQPINGITLNYESYQLEGIGKSFELKATITPDDASNKNIKWKSTDETVCVVSPGEANASENPNCTITSTGKGTCTIIASTVDGGYTAICAVTVVMPKYKLIYMVDGVEYKKYDIEYGAAITPEPAPTKEGYSFSGWSEIPATMPAKDVTVTGTFTVNKYKLVYKVDGIDYKTYEVEYGATITPEAEPTKEGYTFSGWSEIPKSMPAKDVTVTGTFTINKYKLTYMVDGAEYKSYQIEYGAKITPEAEPTKEGYSFSGWSSIPATMPANDVVVTGTFTKGAYKLTYMVDGQVYKTVSYDYGATITPEAAPTKEGYTFSGWSTIPVTMPAKDVTVTGTFTINKYKLVYKVDGEVYKTYEIEYGKAITPEAEPTKEGYTFSGWSTIPATMPAKDVTVTGTFTINVYKLIYLVDGDEYKTYDVEYGARIDPIAEPTKEGYSFSGWSNIPETMPANNVTIKGTFTVNKYVLTYIIDGEVYKTYEVEYGASITPEIAPEKEGYDFSGWDYVPETMPAHDVTVTASFTLGISDALLDSEDVKIFDIQGNQIGKLKKGINIIVYKNGERKKVVIK